MNDLSQGLAYTFATGFFWGGVGIFYSRGAEKKESFYGFMFLSALLFILLTWLFAFPQRAPVREVLLTAALMFPAGIMGQLGFWSMKKALEHGPHGIGWCIVQSSMICPFLAGVLFFGDSPSIGRMVGMGLIAASLLPLSGRVNSDTRKSSFSGRFLLLIAAAFLLVGMQQTVSLLPNQFPALSPEALSWRVPLVSLVGFGWLGPILFRKTGVRFKEIGGISLVYALLVFLGQLGIYRAIDALGKAHSSGTAYPAACGMSILLFFVYCFFRRHEKLSRKALAGIGLNLAGMFLLAIS